MLHGYLEDLYIFDSLTLLLNENGLDVVRIDLPGHGLSMGNLPTTTMAFSALSLKLTLEKLGIDKAFIAGHSMGGYVAQEFAKSYPTMVNGLILLHSNPFADSPQKRESRGEEIKKILSGGLKEVANVAVPKMYANSNVEKFQEQIAAVTESCELYDEEGICSCLRGMAERASYEDFLSTTTLPLLFFFGKEDNYLSLENAHRMEEMSPNAKAVYLDNCGHNGFIENTQAVAQAIANFTTENC